MRKSQVLVVGLALVAGYVLAVALNRPTVGQPPALEALPVHQPDAVARFHTTVLNNGGSYPLLILTDIITGTAGCSRADPRKKKNGVTSATTGSSKKK